VLHERITSIEFTVLCIVYIFHMQGLRMCISIVCMGSVFLIQAKDTIMCT